MSVGSKIQAIASVMACMVFKDMPISSYLKDKKIIDMYKVFYHSFIKNSIYPLKYRDLQLDTVASGMLGYGKYVSESTGIKITGENVTRFSPSEQKKYVLRDAEIVIKLIERNNYEIFNILRCIAEISGLDFKLVCHAGVGRAWEAIIYRMIQTGDCRRPSAIDVLKKRKYAGGIVFEPEPKSYTTPIEVFDVKSLYPTVMIPISLLKQCAAPVVKINQRLGCNNQLWMVSMKH